MIIDETITQNFDMSVGCGLDCRFIVVCIVGITVASGWTYLEMECMCIYINHDKPKNYD